MYVCNDCGYEFNEPILIYGEQLEFWGFPCREHWHGCPSCESSDYIENNDVEE